MISKRTVLVTGAGASVPYGFPTSTGLRQMILGEENGHLLSWGNLTRMVRDRFGSNHPQMGLKQFLLWRVEDLPNGRQLLAALQKRFGDSEVPSIDAFLRFPDNEQFGEVGRALIAAVLLACENVGREQLKGGWYAKLWSYLLDAEARGGFESSKLAVVTFNYERSLQYYLTEKAKHTSLKMQEIVKGIQFEHVYGRLGPLQEPDFVKYGDVPETLPIEGIKLMHPRVEPNLAIRLLLANAERIVFLGFGFNQMNIDALELPIPDALRLKEIWASNFHLDASLRHNSDRALNRFNEKRVIWGDVNDGVEDFLHKHSCLS